MTLPQKQPRLLSDPKPTSKAELFLRKSEDSVTAPVDIIRPIPIKQRPIIDNDTKPT